MHTAESFEIQFVSLLISLIPVALVLLFLVAARFENLSRRLRKPALERARIRKPR